jgi:uncharacterized protein
MNTTLIYRHTGSFSRILTFVACVDILKKFTHSLEHHTMPLKETISADLKSAMKSGDKLRLETLRSLRAGLLEKEIERRGGDTPMTSEDEVGVLTTAAKKRREAIEQFEKGGRADLVAQESAELAIIQEYLPKQLGREEVEKVVRDIIAATGATGPADFSKVMPLAMKELKGKADGRLVQEIVRASLTPA